LEGLCNRVSRLGPEFSRFFAFGLSSFGMGHDGNAIGCRQLEGKLPRGRSKLPRRNTFGPVRPARPPNSVITTLLGLAGIIEQIRWTFDGRNHPDAPFAVCLLENQRPLARRYPN